MARTNVRAHSRRSKSGHVSGVRKHSRSFMAAMASNNRQFLDTAATLKVQAWLDRKFPDQHLKAEVHVDYDAQHDFAQSLGWVSARVKVTGPLGVKVAEMDFKVDPKHNIEANVHLSVPYWAAEKKVRSWLEGGM